ncbi:radical SAM protein [Deinococcus lacus]|uniref:Radical SAM protein n=1 Tax=Deinococcus lacus TaxID=392561 RepID=A0ABW1Y8T3_9DEIO
MHTPWHVHAVGQQVTAFCPSTGTRLSVGPTPERLPAPELLDVKLTDVCSIGCAFCYQDSRPDRQHARLEDVAFIAREAGRAGVFEVALGGGEVSEYPHFVQALHLFRAAGVVPNFTTRNVRWLAQQWPTVRGLVGGVAVSVGSAAQVERVAQLLPQAERRHGQLVAQVVMGTLGRAELLALVQAAGRAGIRVTLLGFKDVGRGQSYAPAPYDWWLDDLPQYVQHAEISIDTALAAECPEALERLLLPGSYHTEEGRFSAYVDAVSMTLAPSSYHAGPSDPFDTDWLTHFAAPDFVQGPPTPPALGRVRLGFATNSSSSHSLVLLRETIEDNPQDIMTWHRKSLSGTAWDSTEENLIVSSELARRYYLASNLLYRSEYLFPDWTEEAIHSEVKRLCNLPSEIIVTMCTVDEYSVMEFDRDGCGYGPNLTQFETVKKFLLQPNMAIFGGAPWYTHPWLRSDSSQAFDLGDANFSETLLRKK